MNDNAVYEAQNRCIEAERKVERAEQRHARKVRKGLDVTGAIVKLGTAHTELREAEAVLARVEAERDKRANGVPVVTLAPVNGEGRFVPTGDVASREFAIGLDGSLNPTGRVLVEGQGVDYAGPGDFVIGWGPDETMESTDYDGPVGEYGALTPDEAEQVAAVSDISVDSILATSRRMARTMRDMAEERKVAAVTVGPGKPDPTLFGVPIEDVAARLNVSVERIRDMFDKLGAWKGTDDEEKAVTDDVDAYGPAPTTAPRPKPRIEDGPPTFPWENPAMPPKFAIHTEEGGKRPLTDTEQAVIDAGKKAQATTEDEPWGMFGRLSTSPLGTPLPKADMPSYHYRETFAPPKEHTFSATFTTKEGANGKTLESLFMPNAKMTTNEDGTITVTAETPERPTGTPEQRLLDEAGKMIGGERKDQYGDAEDSFSTIAAFWSAWLTARRYEIVDMDMDSPESITLTSEDVANMLGLMKKGRTAHGYKRDNYVDEAGYVALAQRCHERGQGL